MSSYPSMLLIITLVQVKSCLLTSPRVNEAFMIAHCNLIDSGREGRTALLFYSRSANSTLIVHLYLHRCSSRPRNRLFGLKISTSFLSSLVFHHSSVVRIFSRLLTHFPSFQHRDSLSLGIQLTYQYLGSSNGSTRVYLKHHG